MPQDTNFNISPYFDDFNKDGDYYKVLFKPGYPIQARELTTLQSILQNQIEQYGRHIFKEGSVIIPGQLKYESPFYCVEIESIYNGIPISLYYNQLIGKRIRGLNSGVSAEIVFAINNIESERGNYTLYLKYIQSGGEDFQNKRFQDSETLILLSPLTYGNFTLQSGQGFCNTISTNSISEGSAVSVADGIYFVRGFFAKVKIQTILLSQYERNPSFKVGFDVIEKIITADDDENLFDNAQGFSNYAAPGADRFKLELILSKKEINDTNLEGFVEILRIENGVTQYFNKDPQYNILRDELAKRTFDESGNYFVKSFNLTIRDSLNDQVLNRGIYFKDQLTASGNTPSEDLMVYQIGPGKAYVNGYDVETISSRLLDIQKPRITTTATNLNVDINAGILCILNNGYGSPKIGIGTESIVKLMSNRVGSDPTLPSGTEIGVARIYDFVPESDYVDETSRLYLRLFDIETYTTITLSQEITLNTPAVIKGNRSNAVGYLRQNTSNTKILNLYEVSGRFLENEPVSINDIDNTRIISNVIDYSLSDVKSLYSQISGSIFSADLFLSTKSYILPPGTTVKINSGVVSAGFNNNFINLVKVGDIVSYGNTSFSGDPIFNKISSISLDGDSFTLSPVTSVSGICNGTVPSGSVEITNILRLSGNFSANNSTLFTEIGRENVSSISISESEIIQRKLFSSETVQNNSLTIEIDSLDVDIFFESFDEDRYVITYNDGTIEPMRFDKFSRSNDLKSVTFSGLIKESGVGIANVISTVVNKSPDSKIKKLNKISSLIVSNSYLTSSGIGTTTLNDGLIYGNVYGTRVQDSEICLNVPDVLRVLAIYESINTSDPKLPYLELISFTGSSNNNQDYLIGEHIVGKDSGATAIIVNRLEFDKLEYAYLNNITFEIGEIIEGEKSKIQSAISDKTIGDKNITQNFILDDGQRDHYYDYGRIIRKSNVTPPSKKIKIIFQNYTIDSSDTGEFITVNSYPVDGYKHDIPTYSGVRLSDIIDIRPRVSQYTLSSKSPFEFDSRKFDSDGQYSKYSFVSNENLLINYSYYQGRIDLINLNSDGIFEVVQGIPSDFPVPPQKRSNCLDIGYVFIPPYVFDVKNITYRLSEYKRYRMSDISLLEDRIDRVEKYTTLSMLESKTENFIIKDAETGLDRFKCGFFADNFSSHDYHDVKNPSFRCAIDRSTNTLRPSHYTTLLDLQLGSEAISGVGQTFSPKISHSFVEDLGSLGIKKTGDLITLSYDEVLYFEQPYATKTESVTPFLVRFWNGLIELRPPIDTWIEERTDITRSSNQVRDSSDTLPDINISATKTQQINRTLFVQNPIPQSGVVGDSLDWITNARTINNGLKPPGSTVKPAFSSAIEGGLASISGNTIRLSIIRSRINTSNRDPLFAYIRSLFPVDVANQYINQIQSGPIGGGTRQTAQVSFTPGTTPVFSVEQQSSVQTSTKTISNTVTTIIPPEIVDLGDTTTEIKTNSQEVVRFLRSRNIEFDVRGLRPLTRFYPFFEGIDVSKYITPKLLEIEMIFGSFLIGETVQSSSTFLNSFFRLRVCSPNHRFGQFDSPSEIFKLIPYTQQIPPVTYSESSTFLNIDTNALQVPSEVEYYGNASIGMEIIGRTSGARARISNIRLISDSSGRLVGSLFIPDPNISENPKWINGDNTFTLIDIPSLNPNLSIISNEIIPNSRSSESTAEAEFTSSSTRNVTNVNILTTRTIKVIPARKQNVTTITNVTENITTVQQTKVQTGQTDNNVRFGEGVFDPLAQSFYVQDESGIFLTSVEVYFQNKDEDLPVTLQIRPLVSGVPSNMVVPFSEVTLSPDEVNLSLTGTIATKFTFPSPVYLNGPQQQEIRQSPIGSQQSSEYAIVIFSGSPNYTVFVAELGQNDILQPNVKISQQPTLGSLFKSQNGTVWNPSQMEDLKYRIYRANFGSSGLVRFFNPKLSNKNKKITVTGENQLNLLSKKIIVGLGSTGYNSNVIVPGVNITQNGSIGTLIGIAGSITVGVGVTISKVGSGYTSGTFSNVDLITETGYGFGSKATIQINTSTTGIGTVTITNGGSGYQVGDSLIIPEIGSGLGFGGKVTVSSISSNNTFVLDNVQGKFTVGITTLNYLNSSGDEISIGSSVNINSITEDQYYTGQHLKVYQINHGMHSSENYVKISKLRPEESDINARLSSDIETGQISIPFSSNAGIDFSLFEGNSVNGSNIGYVIIGEEIIGYTGVSGNTLTSSSSLRGIDGTDKQFHQLGEFIYKYELNGISLRRINKIHNLTFVDKSIHKTDLNSYHIKINMSDTTTGTNRFEDLYFLETIQTGNTGTNITNNIQYEVITPKIANLVFPNTNITSRVRTFSGTSVGGNEKSFVDNGFENISLSYPHFFESPRLICSEVNEDRFIDESPGNRSFTMEFLMNTNDSRVSPVIDIIQTSVILTSNLINNPIGVNNDDGYANDILVRSLNSDNHASVYLSNPIALKLSANSIKVLLSASITSESDIRVLYQISRSDSPNSNLSYDLFPGWANYQVDGQGIKRVVDPSMNNGSPDSKIIKNSDASFRDYEFSVDDLPDFDIFSIKIVMSSTNQSNPPLIKDLRAIATVKPRV